MGKLQIQIPTMNSFTYDDGEDVFEDATEGTTTKAFGSFLTIINHGGHCSHKGETQGQEHPRMPESM